MDIRQPLLSRIFKVLIVSLLTINSNVKAQQFFSQVTLPELMDSHLKEIKIDSLPLNSFLIIATNRSCEKCFSDACPLKDKGPIYLIVFEDTRLSAIPATARHYREIMPCLTSVLFTKDLNISSKDQEQNPLLIKIRSNPTPQMLLKHGDSVEHFSYNRFSQFLIDHPKTIKP